MTQSGQDGTEADDDASLSGSVWADGTELDPLPDAGAYGLPPQTAQPPAGPQPPAAPSPVAPLVEQAPADLPWGQQPPSGSPPSPYAGSAGTPSPTTALPPSAPAWASPPPGTSFPPPGQFPPPPGSFPPPPGQFPSPPGQFPPPIGSPLPWRGGPPPGSPPPGSPPPGRGRGPIWIVAGVVALLLVSGVALGIAFFGRATTAPVTTLPTRSVTSPGNQPSAGPTGSTRSPTPSRPTPTSPGSPTSGATATPPQVPPVVPGWQTVEGREFVAFDVPPDWKVEAPSVLTGFETSGGPHEIVIMHNPATYKKGACAGKSSTYRAKAGFVSAKGQTAGTAATAISAQWAKVAGVHADGSSSPIGPPTVSTVKLAGGSITATVATSVLTVTEPGDCPAPTMSFTAVSFAVKGQVVVFMLYGDQGVPDALPQDVATKVISSLRPI